MRSDIVPGAVFPDYELPDHSTKRRKLSELQGQDPMVLVLGRGGYCPKDRRQAEGLLQLHRELEVGYCRLITITTDNITDTNEYRTGVGAHWPFLSDSSRKIQKDLDIAEYTDSDHNPMIPHTIVLEPSLVIYKIYMGYWFFGRPTMEELRQDLRAVLKKCRQDWDITTPELKAAWQQGKKELFYPYGKTFAQTLREGGDGIDGRSAYAGARFSRPVLYSRADSSRADGGGLSAIVFYRGDACGRIWCMCRAPNAAERNRRLGCGRARERENWCGEVRPNVDGRFQFNLWMPEPPLVRDRSHEMRVREFLSRWGPSVLEDAGDIALPNFDEQCQALLRIAPAAVSSIMGLYPPTFVAELKSRRISWFATATTVADAKKAEAAGADVIVVQGMEAGGHRGAFDATKAEQQL